MGSTGVKSLISYNTLTSTALTLAWYMVDYFRQTNFYFHFN